MFRKSVRSKKKREEQKRNARRWFLGIVGTILVLFVTVVVLLNQSFLRINSIVVYGQETVPTADLEQSVHDVISGKVLWIFPRNTIFFYPKKKIIERLYADFSRVENLKVRMTDFKNLTIGVVEHDPQYLWCGEERAPDEVATELRDCYYMDATSYIFAEAPYFTDHVFLKFLGSHNAISKEPLRSRVFDQGAFEQVLELRELLDEGGIFVNKVVVQEAYDYVLYVDVIDDVRVGAESRILVNLRDSNNKIIENLQLAFDEERFQKKLRTIPEALEYIDLRFPDKIVYRFTPGVIVADTSSE